MTIVTVANGQGLAVADRTLTVTASGGDIFLGPFPPAIYNDSSGNVEFTLATSIAGLDVAVVQY